jgi:hypothetical protein
MACIIRKARGFASSEVTETAFASKRAYMTCKNGDLREVTDTAFASRRACLTCKARRFVLSEVAETAFASRRTYNLQA